MSDIADIDHLASVTPLHGRRRRSGQRGTRNVARVAAVLVGAVMVAAGVGTVVSRRAGPGPAEDLAAIRAFLRDASTARFDARLDVDAASADPSGPAFREKVRGEGEMIMAGRSRWLLTTSARKIETIFRPEGFYRRSADDNGFLSNEVWALSPGRGSERSVPPDGFSVDFLAAFEDVPSAVGVVQPVALRQVVEKLRNPERLRPGVIRGSLPLAEIDGTDGLEGLVGRLTVDLTFGDSGRLRRVVWKVTTHGTAPIRTHEGFPRTGGVSLRVRSELVFGDWDDDHLVVAQPADSQINYLPDPVVEEDVLAYTDTTVVGPRDLPSGWRLEMGWVGVWQEGKTGAERELRPLPQAATRRSDGCRSVLLVYRDPDRHRRWVDGGSVGPVPPDLTLILSPVECVSQSGLRHPEPYRAGVYFGRIGRPAQTDVDSLVAGDTPVISAEIVVGTTAVEATAALPEAEFTRVLASFAPLNLVPA